jgi:threonine/homoserine/homoserine lactone efflux protein
MNNSIAVIGIGGALLIGAMSPGPSFLIVAKRAVTVSRRSGLFTALGMGIGSLGFCCLALTGLYTLLNEVSWLYSLLRVAGGAYLIYMAWHMWHGAATPLRQARPEAENSDVGMSIWSGTISQLSNPKTALVYASIFSALLPLHPAHWVYFALPPIVFFVEAGWYTLVALCFSSERPRRFYMASKFMIDRLAAGVLGALGIRLIM